LIFKIPLHRSLLFFLAGQFYLYADAIFQIQTWPKTCVLLLFNPKTWVWQKRFRL